MGTAVVEAEGKMVVTAEAAKVLEMVAAKVTAVMTAVATMTVVGERRGDVAARIVAEAVRVTGGREEGAARAEGVLRAVAIREIVPAQECPEGLAAQMPGMGVVEEQEPTWEVTTIGRSIVQSLELRQM